MSLYKTMNTTCFEICILNLVLCSGTQWIALSNSLTSAFPSANEVIDKKLFKVLKIPNRKENSQKVMISLKK